MRQPWGSILFTLALVNNGAALSLTGGRPKASDSAPQREEEDSAPASALSTSETETDLASWSTKGIILSDLGMAEARSLSEHTVAYSAQARVRGNPALADQASEVVMAEANLAAAEIWNVSNASYAQYFQTEKEIVKSLVTDPSKGEALFQALLNDAYNSDATEMTRRETMQNGRDYQPLWQYFDRTPQVCVNLQRLNDAASLDMYVLTGATMRPEVSAGMGALSALQIFAQSLVTLTDVVSEGLAPEGQFTKCELADTHPEAAEIRPYVNAFVDGANPMALMFKQVFGDPQQKAMSWAAAVAGATPDAANNGADTDPEVD
jgi:hypothetical protein